jgi:hypothetical protein
VTPLDQEGREIPEKVLRPKGDGSWLHVGKAPVQVSAIRVGETTLSLDCPQSLAPGTVMRVSR